MLLKKHFFILGIFLLSSVFCAAQIEVVYARAKDFSGVGFGAFLNFGIPVTEGNALTLEGGLQYVGQIGDGLITLPVLVGYRFTFDQTGTGFYVEPHGGYNFGVSDIAKYTENGAPVYENGEQVYWKIKGPMVGLGLGYLFEPSGRIQFNVALRYEFILGEAKTQTFGFRISHAFSFGKREEY